MMVRVVRMATQYRGERKMFARRAGRHEDAPPIRGIDGASGGYAGAGTLGAWMQIVGVMRRRGSSTPGQIKLQTAPLKDSSARQFR